MTSQQKEDVQKTPSTNLQAPENNQTSSIKGVPCDVGHVTGGDHWSLKFGYSLELGGWNLELPIALYHRSF
jgi:hypothetical protein